MQLRQNAVRSMLRVGPWLQLWQWLAGWMVVSSEPNSLRSSNFISRGGVGHNFQQGNPSRTPHCTEYRELWSDPGTTRILPTWRRRGGSKTRPIACLSSTYRLAAR
ncbi:hypothetical protein LX36DRAFT_45100 [Colletotrichum falcatum]|nr:hypothetical protein LX36DRAFT_45100 [Colletotrichum falcatum]